MLTHSLASTAKGDIHTFSDVLRVDGQMRVAMLGVVYPLTVHQYTPYVKGRMMKDNELVSPICAFCIVYGLSGSLVLTTMLELLFNPK